MLKLMENVFDDSDIWECNLDVETKFVDGVEFVAVRKPGSSRWLLMRKDSLKPHRKKFDSLLRQ